MGNDGFVTGLKLCLIFFLTFYLLQYPVFFSLILGLAAGLAGNVIASALYTLKLPKKLLPPPKPEGAPTERRRFGLSVQANQWAWIPWFGRNGNRGSKSRR
ncbi:MAG: hypothetical protein AAFX78_01590 [Cyanobacteria bacterium J06638_20]